MNFSEEPNLTDRKRKRFDSFFIGFIPSIILPFILIILISAKEISGIISPYEHFMRAYHNYMFVKIAILSLVPNLILFFFLYKTERWKSASGLIVATVFFLMLMILKV